MIAIPNIISIVCLMIIKWENIVFFIKVVDIKTAEIGNMKLTSLVKVKTFEMGGNKFTRTFEKTLD